MALFPKKNILKKKFIIDFFLLKNWIIHQVSIYNLVAGYTRQRLDVNLISVWKWAWALIICLGIVNGHGYW